jgi:hypothetical protein
MSFLPREDRAVALRLCYLSSVVRERIVCSDHLNPRCLSVRKGISYWFPLHKVGRVRRARGLLPRNQSRTLSSPDRRCLLHKLTGTTKEKQMRREAEFAARSN